MAINSYRDDENNTEVSKLNTLLRLFRYLTAYRLKIILVLLIMGICVTISLLNPLIIQRAVDYHVARKDLHGLIKLGIFAVSINILMVILIKVRMYIMAGISNKVLLTIRQELYEHIQKLSFDFFDSRPTGKVLSRIIGDVNALKDVLSDSVTTLIPDFITVCSVIAIMMVKNARLALAALISLPLMIVGMWFIQIYSHKRWQINKKKASNMNAFVHEDLSGMRIIQSFTAEEETNHTFDVLVKEHRQSFVDAVRLNDAFGPLIDLCWGIGSVSLYYTAIKILGAEHVSVGTLIAFGTYITMFWSPVMNLSNFYNQIVTNISGAERIFEIMDTPLDITDTASATELPSIQGKVEFKDVCFSYEDGTPVLNHVNFHIHAGETIALVGPTGAGKSTIVNLISRFYDIQQGDILVDDYNVKDVSMESLRKQMGIMTQDNFLFSGTIKENIRYGKLDATDEEIIEAAKLVHAHDFIIKLEHGYDTELQERGGGLSIGQKQLLAFARTMASMPKILILDEATSSIDTKTELLVQQGIEALLKNRTSFVIAHRLSTIQKADRIFVIDEGQILEQGTATELLEKQGLYYNLHMAQFKNL
jgi:ABC-type multidrug transport system, ATPase and permease components